MLNVYYTCVLGRRDLPQPIELQDGWQFVLLTDQPDYADVARSYGYEVWEMDRLPAATRTRTARRFKHQPFNLFPEAQLIVWVDATHELLVPVDELANHLGDADMALFTHSRRKTVREEIAAAATWKLDDPLVMQARLDKYEADGFRDDVGLWGTACLIRRRTPQMIRLQLDWAKEIEEGSQRDQVSLPFVAWQHFMRGFPPFGVIPGDPRGENPCFRFHPHSSA